MELSGEFLKSSDAVEVIFEKSSSSNRKETSIYSYKEVEGMEGVERRIRRNSQSLGQLSPVDIINEVSTTKLSPTSNKLYTLSEKTYSLESRFNNSSIHVIDFEIK